MCFGPTLSGDEFVGDVFWTYLFGADVCWPCLFGGGRVARPVLDLALLPRGPVPVLDQAPFRY